MDNLEDLLTRQELIYLMACLDVADEQGADPGNGYGAHDKDYGVEFATVRRKLEEAIEIDPEIPVEEDSNDDGPIRRRIFIIVDQRQIGYVDIDLTTRDFQIASVVANGDRKGEMQDEGVAPGLVMSSLHFKKVSEESEKEGPQPCQWQLEVEHPLTCGRYDTERFELINHPGCYQYLCPKHQEMYEQLKGGESND